MFKFLKSVFWFIIGAAIVVALLRAFGGDPFAVIKWGLDWIYELILRASDLLSGNESFQKITEAPA